MTPEQIRDAALLIRKLENLRNDRSTITSGRAVVRVNNSEYPIRGAVADTVADSVQAKIVAVRDELTALGVTL